MEDTSHIELDEWSVKLDEVISETKMSEVYGLEMVL